LILNDFRVDDRTGACWILGRSLSRREEDRRGPGRNEIQKGDELGEKGWKERPMPSYEKGHRNGDCHIENVIDDRRRPAGEDRKDDDLQKIGRDRDAPGRANANGGQGLRCQLHLERLEPMAEGVKKEDLGGRT
jgi:hypothetical protein